MKDGIDKVRDKTPKRRSMHQEIDNKSQLIKDNFIQPWQMTQDLM